MSCASIIRAISLYVLAASNTVPASSDQVVASEPPSSTTITPTVAPLGATSCCKAASNGGAAAATGPALATDPPAGALVRDPPADAATEVVTCLPARAATINGDMAAAMTSTMRTAATRRPTAQTCLESASIPARLGSVSVSALGGPCEVAQKSPQLRQVKRQADT